MGLLVFAGRNRKEISRDPINLAFGLGLPIVILLLLSAILFLSANSKQYSNKFI